MNEQETLPIMEIIPYILYHTGKTCMHFSALSPKQNTGGVYS